MKIVTNLTSLLILGNVFVGIMTVDIACDASQNSSQGQVASLQRQKIRKPVLFQNTELGPGFYTQNEISIPMKNVYVEADHVQDFLGEIKSGAIEGWKKYHVLPSISAAQAIIESGWGTSALAIQGKNIFGIKGEYEGKSIYFPTQEYENGQMITINAAFRKYPSWSASIEDHGRFLSVNSRYHNLLGNRNYRTVAKELQDDGYATAPNYASVLVSVVQDYNLEKWDQEAFKNNKRPVSNRKKEVERKKTVAQRVTDVSGSYIFKKMVSIRTAPNMKGEIVGTYNSGQVVHYSEKVTIGKQVWLGYKSISGAMHYVNIVS